MGSEAADHDEQSYSPTKLSLLISRQSKPLEMPTPTPQTTVSVPFQWEEAPGKPRPCPAQSKPKTTASARTLELPPRLLFSEAKISNMPSPTTVLDGPYVGRAMSFTTTYRSSRGLGTEYWNGHFGSGKWSSFRKTKEDVDGSLDFLSYTVGGRCSDGTGSGTNKAKIARLRRSLYQTKSHLWSSIYESLKQVVPWRRRQEKRRKWAPKFDTV